MWQTKYALAVPKIWKLEWIFGHAVKTISSPGVCSQEELIEEQGTSDFYSVNKKVKDLINYHHIDQLLIYTVAFSEYMNFNDIGKFSDKKSDKEKKEK